MNLILEMTEDIFSKFANRSIKFLQSVQQRENRLKKVTTAAGLIG